ncbi:MAG: sigma-70 family RNA polymerase sigma factor [Bacteroidota bacterium]
MTDKALIEGCIKENKQCQKELFLRYAGKMLTVCRRYARHQLEAEDILQDAFIKVFDKINQFKFNGSFEGWIRRIVVNTALKNYQKSSFQKEQIGIEDYEENGLEPTVYAQLHQEELLALISALPDGYRVVFNLYVLEGFSHKEIAQSLGIQAATSRSQLLKARKMLQAQILKLQKISA